MTPEEVAENLDEEPGVYDNEGDGKEWDEEGEEEEEEEDADEPAEESEDFGPSDTPLPNSPGDPIDAKVYIRDLDAELLIHLRVYIMAHVYDVPSLRLLARDRFYRAAEMCYATSEGFPDAVDELYEKVVEGDIALREIVCRLTASRYVTDEKFKERIEPVMRKRGDFAVGVINWIVRRNTTMWT